MATMVAAPALGWREAAMRRALHAASYDGYSIEALARSIRQARPAGALLLLWDGLERRMALEFLATLPGGPRPCLSGRTLVWQRQDAALYCGWYECAWEGEPVEVVLAPTTDHEGHLLLLGDDEGALRRLIAAIDEYAQRPQGRCLRYSFRWQPAPDLEAEVGATTWDDLVLPPALLAGIREAVEGFFRHRAAYAAFGFGWRRGVLLIGPPGTGKTMVCKATAAALRDLPFLYVRDFQHERGDAVRAIFARARKLAPCILAFEDIDGLVNEHNRTLFLNELDGFQSNEGLLVIASSNHPGQIDEALLKRPSRFDRVFHVGLPGLPERREFCRRLLARLPGGAALAGAPDLAERVAERTEGFTLAYLKEVFTGAALNRAEAGSMALDTAFADAALAQVEELGRYLHQARNPNDFADWREAGDAQIGFRPVIRLPGR